MIYNFFKYLCDMYIDTLLSFFVFLKIQKSSPKDNKTFFDGFL